MKSAVPCFLGFCVLGFALTIVKLGNEVIILVSRNSVWHSAGKVQTPPPLSKNRGGGGGLYTGYKNATANRIQNKTITILRKSWLLKKKFNFKHFSLWLIIGCVPSSFNCDLKIFKNFPVLRFLEAYAKCVIRIAIIIIIIIIIQMMWLSFSQSKSWLQKQDSFK